MSRCAGCGEPVDQIGDTCSLKCYRHMVSMVYNGFEVDEIPVDLYDQPWYEEEKQRIDRMAEAHEIDGTDLERWFGRDEGNEYYDESSTLHEG